jgi:hypothetical protein
MAKKRSPTLIDYGDRGGWTPFRLAKFLRDRCFSSLTRGPEDQGVPEWSSVERTLGWE